MIHTIIKNKTTINVLSLTCNNVAFSVFISVTFMAKNYLSAFNKCSGKNCDKVEENIN